MSKCCEMCPLLQSIVRPREQQLSYEERFEMHSFRLKLTAELDIKSLTNLPRHYVLVRQGEARLVHAQSLLRVMESLPTGAGDDGLIEELSRQSLWKPRTVEPDPRDSYHRWRLADRGES